MRVWGLFVAFGSNVTPPDSTQPAPFGAFFLLALAHIFTEIGQVCFFSSKFASFWSAFEGVRKGREARGKGVETDLATCFFRLTRGVTPDMSAAAPSSV